MYIGSGHRRGGVRVCSAAARLAGPAVAIAGVGMLGSPAAMGALNTADNFKGGTSLAAAGNWSGGLPTATNDAEFTSYPASGTLVGVLSNLNPTYGSLDDLNTGAIISVGDNSGTVSGVLSLGNGGANNAVAPNAADLLYVAAGANLSIVPTQTPGNTGYLSLKLLQTGNFDAAGPLNISSVVTSASGAAIGINKTGGGVLTLSGANTYTGATNVSLGTLRLNNTAGSGTSSSAVDVFSGATLGGSGIIGNGTHPVTVDGTITAGADSATVGKLTTDAQIWDGGGNFLSKVSDSAGTITGNDKLQLNGLTFGVGTGAPFEIDVTSLTGSAVYTGTPLVLVDDIESASTNPFTAANQQATLQNLHLVTTGLTNAYGGTFALGVQPDATNGYDLILTTVPEPTSVFILCVSAIPMAMRRRRRDVSELS